MKYAGHLIWELNALIEDCKSKWAFRFQKYLLELHDSPIAKIRKIKTNTFDYNKILRQGIHEEPPPRRTQVTEVELKIQKD